MLVQQIYPQLVRPPVSVRGATAGHVTERAFFFRYSIHLSLLLLDKVSAEARDAGIDEVLQNRLFACEPEMKSIVSITTIDGINLFNVSLRFLVARCKDDQIRNFLRVRHQ